ncbi:isoprenylcysteine carboxyl methyltransferase, partial [bacterium]|nr:isoprenylcysteine carboxyl methyltransferase [bacterium]
MKIDSIKKMPVWKYFIYAVITAIFPPGIVMLLAGDWIWIEGWCFSVWFDVMILSNSIYLYKHNPELLADRASLPGSKNQKKWDKYLMIVIYLLFMIWFVIIPLDARRFSWSPDFPLWLKIIGGIALLPSLYLEYQTAVENAFLSTQVKIQKDRKQKVITTGVYSFVRHPKYLG